MIKLVVGCGPWEPKENTIGLDIIKEFNPDVIRDITRGLPFDSDKFDEVEAFHILEHLESNKDFLFVMNEINRVLKPQGILNIAVPFYKSPAALNVYEHTRFFNEDSFMNFYSNPYAKEMGIILWEHVEHKLRDKDGGHEVFVSLRKL